MLEITIHLSEEYDEENSMFIPSDPVKVQLEHSLVSLSKWESKHEKRFLDDKQKTAEEYFDYILMMNLTPEIPPEVFEHMSSENIEAIKAYIGSKQSGTTFPEERNDPKTREQISSELIYYWMVKCQIPWEAQHWHINRLFTLIKVYTLKENEANRKQNPKAINNNTAADRKAENARRRAEMQSRG